MLCLQTMVGQGLQPGTLVGNLVMQGLHVAGQEAPARAVMAWMGAVSLLVTALLLAQGGQPACTCLRLWGDLSHGATALWVAREGQAHAPASSREPLIVEDGCCVLVAPSWHAHALCLRAGAFQLVPAQSMACASRSLPASLPGPCQAAGKPLLQQQAFLLDSLPNPRLTCCPRLFHGLEPG